MSGPPAPPPGSMRWTIRGILGTTRWEIGWWLLTHQSHDPDASELHATHGALLLAANDFFSGCCPDEVTAELSRLVVYGIAVERSDEQFYNATGARGGSAPAGICPVVVWHVQSRGKGQAGRTFLPGVAQVDTQLESQLGALAQSQLQTEMVDFVTTVTGTPYTWGSGLEFGVLHRRESGAWLAAAQLRPVDSFIVRPHLASQVRRLRSSTL